MDGLKILSLEASSVYESNVINKDYVIKNLNLKYRSTFDDSLDLRFLLKNKSFKVFKDDNLDATNDIINIKFKKTYKCKKNSKNDVNLLNLRKILYEDGFKLKFKDKNNNYILVEYVRFKRSSGSSRNGKCLFIKKELYEKVNKWSLCGLNENNKKIQDDLVSFEAYKALSLSGIIDVINIKPENILLVDDFECTFKTKCVNVKKDDNDEVVAVEEETLVNNNIWDGEGLLDKEFFSGKYENNGMMYLRNKFFKGCVFNTNLQDFFKEKQVFDVKDLNGETIASNITDIKLVITKSCLKYLKFGSFKKWLKNIGNEFGIIKVDEPSHFFGGNVVMTTYQFINTLQFEFDDVKKLISDETEFLKYLKNDPDFVRFHILKNSSHKNHNDSNEIDISTIYKKAIVTLKLLMINNQFKDTKMYYDFVEENINSLMNQMNSGKVFVNGTYVYLFGNGYELLLNTIKEFNKDNPKSLIENNTVMTKFYKNCEMITGARNPHITMGNILIAENKYYEEYNKWFNLSKYIICVNAINENLQQRLNGCDYDSDSMLITNNELIYKTAKKNYDKFGVPVCGLSENNKHENNLYQIDYDIYNNQIGPIVNLSQILNSILWDKLYRNENISGIYNDICILAVLSGIEIDKAKRDYGISALSIMNKIRKKHLINEIDSPMLLKKVRSQKNELEDLNDYKYFDTSMDYLIRLVEEIKIEKIEHTDHRSSIIELMNDVPKPGGPNYNNKDMVIPIIEETYNKINAIKKEAKEKKKTENEDIDYKKLHMLIQNEYDKAMKEIGQKLKSPQTVKLILEELDKSNKGKFFWDTLFYLLKKNKYVFDKCFKKNDFSSNYFSRIIEDENGKIDLFGIKYLKDNPKIELMEDPNGNTIIAGKRYHIIFSYKK